MNLSESILFLFPNAIPLKDFVTESAPYGTRIMQWNLNADRPTEEQLEQAWQSIQAIKEARSLFNSKWDEVFTDGEKAQLTPLIVEVDRALKRNNLDKAVNILSTAQVSSVSLKGKIAELLSTIQ